MSLTDNSQPAAQQPAAAGFDWRQKVGLIGAALSDAASRVQGRPGNQFQNTLAATMAMNDRRAQMATPWTGDANAYVGRLQSLGVPLDVALRLGAGFRSLEAARTLSPDETAAKGFRAGTVVQQSPSGEDSVVQQSDTKSPAAVAQEFDIARNLPLTQDQQGRLDILKARYGMGAPSAAAPPQAATPYIPALHIPTLARPEDALSLPRGSIFRTPDGQLLQVP